MNYTTLFTTDRPVRVGLIGTGAFGTSFLAQASAIPNLIVTVVSDRNIEIGVAACRQAGRAQESIVACANARAVQRTVESGRTAVVDDPTLLVTGPVDLLVEATGDPGAGAEHAHLALTHGLHVVMVSKETDSVVGPILAKMARDAGLVYTPGDGDQPALLIGLITWAETLGLEIICAGKAAEADMIFDPSAGVVAKGRRTLQLTVPEMDRFFPDPAADLIELNQARRQSLSGLCRASVADLCEMAIVMNNSGYNYDRPQLHAPVARLSETVELFGAQSEGGLLSREGVVDVVNCLRGPDEVGMAGGVFVVVHCQDDDTWRMLASKGHILNRSRNRALLYLPRHLLGVEIATSIFCAALLGQPTGGVDVRPMVDVTARTTEALPAGTLLSMDHGHAIAGLTPELAPMRALADANPIPYYLAAGRRLARDVAAGDILTGAMFEPAVSTLERLRMEQDRVFAPEIRSR